MRQLASKNLGQLLWGKWAFALIIIIIFKYLAQCLYFETIKHRVSVLKLDFQKIKFLIELDFYDYRALGKFL